MSYDEDAEASMSAVKEVRNLTSHIICLSIAAEKPTQITEFIEKCSFLKTTTGC
jgi:hypothetical protein